MSFEHKKVVFKEPIRKAYYMGLGIAVPNNTNEPEAHLTLRLNPKDSWEATTRALTIDQLLLLREDVETAIRALNSLGQSSTQEINHAQENVLRPGSPLGLRVQQRRQFPERP